MALDKTITDAARRAGVPVAAMKHLPAPLVNAAILGKDGYQLMPLDRIKPSPLNRKERDAAKYKELVESVREHGVISPIMIRPLPREAGSAAEEMLPVYEIVYGEGRWMACGDVGLKEIPAIIRGDMDERAAEELRLTENLQREDLRPVDEARGFKRLMELGASIADLVKKLNRSQASIYNRLKLLELPETILKEVEAGKLSASHADLAVRIENPEVQAKFVKEILTPKEEWVDGEKVEREVSVREAKVLADRAKEEAEREEKWNSETKKFRQEGMDVLSLEASEKVFKPYSNQLKDSYVSAEAVCPYDDRKWTWRRLMDVFPNSPQAMVAADSHSGKPVIFYPFRGACSALKRSGIVIPAEKDEKLNAADLRKKQLEEQAAQRELMIEGDKRRLAPVIAAVESREPNAGTWRFIADDLAERNEWDLEILGRRGIDYNREKGGWDAHVKALKGYIAKADGKVLRGLVIEMLLWDCNRVDEAKLRRLAGMVNVKLQTVVKGKK